MKHTDSDKGKKTGADGMDAFGSIHCHSLNFFSRLQIIINASYLYIP